MPAGSARSAAPAPKPAEYTAGVVDGDASRRRGDAISTLRLVAINDDYSAGFRAGFFQRG